MKKISVIIPAYNEATNIPLMRERLTAFFESTDDDHSTDETPDLVKDWIRHDARIRLIRLSRNFGSHAGFHAGLAECTGGAASS